MATTDRVGTGVIVGRFQVPELHQGHIDLIEEALGQCAKVIVFVGRHRNPLLLTRSNPLDYWCVSNMIKAKFPNKELIVAPVFDKNNDEQWSKILDETIFQLSPRDSIAGNITLFGSTKGSFLDRYTGRFPSQKLSHSLNVSAVHIRTTVGREPLDSLDFRRGIIYGMENQKKTIILPTVDIALFNAKEQALLLCSRKDEKRVGFPGGFLEGSDEDACNAAYRELREELNNVEATDFQFVGQVKVKDWRDASNTVCFTTLFIAKYKSGNIYPTDDLEGGSASWARLHDVSNLVVNSPKLFVGDHCKLADMTLSWLDKHKEYTS